MIKSYLDLFLLLDLDLRPLDRDLERDLDRDLDLDLERPPPLFSS